MGIFVPDFVDDCAGIFWMAGQKKRFFSMEHDLSQSDLYIGDGTFSADNTQCQRSVCESIL